MKEFNELLDILETLLAPNGCPWDREQTMKSVRHLLLEESYEVIEAIDLEDNPLMEEELGDLLFNAIFMCRMAEKEKRFTLKDALKHVIAKLIRRHPHIFGTAKVKNSEEVLKQWEEIKKQEKTHRSLLDNIPKNFPALAKAQKMIKKMSKTSFPLPISEHKNPYKNEDTLGSALFDCVKNSQDQGLDAELALLNFLAKLEKDFRNWEITNSK